MSKKQKYHQSIVPGNGMAVSVPSKDIGFAIRIWKKKLKDSDVIKTLKERKEYTRPSVEKRKLKNTAIYRQKLQSSQE